MLNQRRSITCSLDLDHIRVMVNLAHNLLFDDYFLLSGTASLSSRGANSVKILGIGHIRREFWCILSVFEEQLLVVSSPGLGAL